jgi:hypothetical protein
VRPICAEVFMEPNAGCLLKGICCQWCLVIMKVIVADAQVGDDALILASVAVKAVAAEALALVGEGCLWLVVAPSALPCLARSIVA